MIMAWSPIKGGFTQVLMNNKWFRLLTNIQTSLSTLIMQGFGKCLLINAHYVLSIAKHLRNTTININRLNI